MGSSIPRTWDLSGAFFDDLSDLHRDLDSLFESVFRPVHREP